MRRRIALVVGAVGVLVTTVILVAVLGGFTRAVEQPVAPSAQSQEPSSPPTAQPPKQEELQVLQEAVVSGDSATVLNALGLSTTRTVNAATLTQLQTMHITFDASNIRQIADGPAWEIDAKDSSGKLWNVGFLRQPDGKLIIAYEEPVQ
jgi:hypothetical protein